MKLIPIILMMATTTLAIHVPVEAKSKKDKKKSRTEKKVTPPQKPQNTAPTNPTPVVRPNPCAPVLSKLNQHASLYQELSIQNSDLTYAMRKALSMAELLVASDGSLNIAICSTVKANFIPAHPKEYEVNMGKVLDQLDTSWQAFFATVKAPAASDSVSALTLRALFSMEPEQPITDWHAKVAVLAAMLAPYNQGPVGDCFAVNDVIRDHQEYYLHAAEDYQSIVMNGYVSRLVDGNTDYFFYLPTLADDDMSQPFTINSDGTLPNTDYSLLDVPGFSAASRLMGASGISDLTTSVMEALAASSTSTQLQVTPAQVIAAMAQVVAATMQNADVNGLNALGAYAFSSLTNNPVLRGVEAAFAAMAEDRPNDSMRSSINSCVDQALTKTWAKLQSKEGMAQFKNSFYSQFNASYRLLYNLNIPLPQVSADGSSTDGGFQLYQRVSGDPTQLGTRVATPQDFKKLVMNAVLAAAQELGSTSSVMDIMSSLKSVVGMDDFLKAAFWAYDPANTNELDPVKNYQTLSSTPMQSCYGDNPFEVDDIDTGTSYDNNVQTHTVVNANDLITWCLNLAKVAPAELIPMDSPQHAFNFVPTNPDIASFLSKKMTTDQWIQNILVVPGMQVSQSQISVAIQQNIANQMYQQLQNAIPDPSIYVNAITPLIQPTISVRDFANQFVNGVNNLLNSDANQANQVGIVVDALLLQNLAANSQAILNSSAIRFAFTNWNQGTEDIYFCAYFNPRTERVAFGTIFEDKTNLQPMDESAWVNNQQWGVDLTPNAPVNEAVAG